ncbi:MAG: ATP-binding protein [Clostridiales Family XIII bacterium]|jgi:AAA+ ATPase superfamily predicted ATPase|nr:ATP-binding protein [Clostridiales Family XIII bacterium]
MFVGRSAELDTLGKAYREDGFQFPVIYGRRRVGKTTLINEFCKGKKTVYFVAVQSTLKENLKILSNQILSTIAPGAPKNPFASFREAIDYVFQTAKDERIVFAIDEYPYLAESDRSVSSVLQTAIDKYHADSNLFLILCGSSMSFMEEQVLGYKSPLYGRRTAQFKLLPFDCFTSSEMMKGFSNEEKIVLYSITGGIPEYLSRIGQNLSVYENVRNLLFDPSGRLFEEPPNLLKQELKIPQTYNAIITAIADGSSRLNKIATRAGVETSQCSKMLNTLAGLGLVKKEVPVTEEQSSKKTIYLLDDQLFIFWHRFILPELSRITAGLGDVVCAEVFEEQLSGHVGHAFEKCAIQYMWRLLKQNQSPVPFRKIGRWWGNNPKERREEEIDFIGFAKDNALFGECKWRNQATGEEVLDGLIRKSEILPAFRHKHYILFSKSGFTASLQARAGRQNDVTLVTADEMF